MKDQKHVLAKQGHAHRLRSVLQERMENTEHVIRELLQSQARLALISNKRTLLAGTGLAGASCLCQGLG